MFIRFRNIYHRFNDNHYNCLHQAPNCPAWQDLGKDFTSIKNKYTYISCIHDGIIDNKTT